MLMSAPETGTAATVKAVDTTRTAGALALTRFKRGFVFMTVMCTAIGLFIAAIDRGNLHYKLLYSFCIGFSCWFMTDVLRIVVALWMDRRREQRGQPLGEKGFDIGWRGMVPAMVLAMLFGPVIGTSLGDLVTGFDTPNLFNMTHTGSRLTLAMTAIGSLVALAWVTTMERLAATRAAAEAAQRQAAENQLKLLESQLEPHMLFNTLATLRVLIGVDATRAQHMLDRLIAFLRATLSASRTGSHPLSAEFERLSDYLALMSLRMGPRLQVVLDLPEALRHLPVPPLLLQPLVENCIRHGLEPKVAGGRIEVRARRDGGHLLLTVRDTGVGLDTASATSGTRFGLEQVRARLNALHGAQARFDIRACDDAEGGTEARIHLPWPRETS